VKCGDWYDTVYNDLCRHTHGNLDAMALRHFRNGHIVFEKTPDHGEFVFAATTTIGLAAASLEQVCALLQVEEQGRGFVSKAVDIRSRGKQLAERPNPSCSDDGTRQR
jgi:hypothetical protein